MTNDNLAPVAVARCWEEPRYEKPPRQMFELEQLDGFRSLPAGSHFLYTQPLKRAPLSIQELLRMYDDCGGDWCKVARTVEAAHGIGA